MGILDCFGFTASSSSASKRKQKKRRQTCADVICHRQQKMEEMEEEEMTPVSDSNGNHQQQQPEQQPRIALVVHRRQFSVTEVNTLSYHLPYGYDISRLEYLGGGSYGNVIKCACVRRSDGRVVEVTIKKMHRPFGSVSTARRVFREIRLLQLMRHDNVLRAIDLFSPDRDFASFNDMYVVTEYAGHSLYEILKNQREAGVQHLSLDHVRFVLYQLLRGMKYIHSANVMHRDLKPSNLALTKNCDLTVLDFGLARIVESQQQGMSTYVMTRWYRSPEIMYWKIGSYDTQADVWSVGCIAAEMMINEPLFPGESTNSQYEMITALCGAPDDELLNKIEEKNGVHIRDVIEKISQNRERRNFADYFRSKNPQIPDAAIDFLDKLLVLDPERRFTVEQAMQHAYLSEFSDPTDEPTVTEPYTLDNQDNTEYTMQDWRRIIWNEIQGYRGDEASPPFVYEE